MPKTKDNPLGIYLRDRRAKLDPIALGFPMARRRTPGLRREEVAQRAHVSATWYTWLEQGRGGLPSPDVLERIARALMLTTGEREHLFLIGLGHPPEVRYEAKQGVSPRIQRILDGMDCIPAFVKTVTWDIVAWNRAGGAIFGFETLTPDRRNILRRLFFDPRARAVQREWQSAARFAVAGFRADTARAGASENVKELIDELCRLSPDFEMMWRENDVHAHAEGTKELRHPVAGMISLEYSSFSVVGRPDLSLVIYNPATPKDANRIRRLIKSRAKPKPPRLAER